MSLPNHQATFLDTPISEQSQWWEKNIGKPDFRLKQAQHWFYQSFVIDAKQMKNLPKALQEKLSKQSPPTLNFEKVLKASDHSADKYLFSCYDGSKLESVLLRNKNHRTICMSTQVGCALACKFCHTGLAGYKRNLNPSEMVEQIIRISSIEDQRISNIVVMGMGEPMLNYDQLLIALRQINHKDGLNLGARHITISTSGVKEGILKLANEPEQWGLAISLHAANDKLRSELMPINKSLPLSELMKEVDHYIQSTKRRVTFEYIMLGEVNSSSQHAHQLAKLLKGKLCHINLIPYNPVPSLPYKATDKKNILEFQSILQKSNLACTIRFEKGQDILAACGQLAHKEAKLRS